MGGFSGKRRTVKRKSYADNTQAATRRSILLKFGVDIGSWRCGDLELLIPPLSCVPVNNDMEYVRMLPGPEVRLTLCLTRHTGATKPVSTHRTS